MSVVQSVAPDILENEPVLQRMRADVRLRQCRIVISEKIGRGFVGCTFSCSSSFDHADRRGAAAGETFDKLDAVISIGANRNRDYAFLRRRLFALDSGRRARFSIN